MGTTPAAPLRSPHGTVERDGNGGFVLLGRCLVRGTRLLVQNVTGEWVAGHFVLVEGAPALARRLDGQPGMVADDDAMTVMFLRERTHVRWP